MKSRFLKRGISVPVYGLKIKATEFPQSDVHDAQIINKYNAGKILWRIASCVDKFTYQNEMGAEESKNEVLHFILQIHSLSVSEERLLE